VQDVVGSITKPVREVLHMFALGPVSLVLLAFGVVFAAVAIWARSLAPDIFAAPEFLGLLGFAALLAVLGWSERLVTLRSGPSFVEAIGRSSPGIVEALGAARRQELSTISTGDGPAADANASRSDDLGGRSHP
jgi:hypothetical protein